MTKPFYNPAYIGDVKIQQEFLRIASTLNALDLSKMPLVNREPEKPRQGIFAVADGSGWDPVSTGEPTPVWYNGTEWKELGSSQPGPPGPAAPPTVPINLQSGESYTLVLEDAGYCIEMSNSNPNQVIVPLDASVPFEEFMTIQVRQVGTGQRSVVGANGVTIRTPLTANVRAQCGTVALHWRAANEWVLMGDLG